MKRKKSGVVTKIVVLSLIVAGTASLVSMRGRIASAKEERADLQAEVKNLNASNTALEYEISHSGEVETIEDIAREKLGLVLPGETVYYDIRD